MVRAEKPGFGPVERSVEVVEGEPVSIELRLEPLAVAPGSGARKLVEGPVDGSAHSGPLVGRKTKLFVGGALVTGAVAAAVFGANSLRLSQEDLGEVDDLRDAYDRLTEPDQVEEAKQVQRDGDDAYDSYSERRRWGWAGIGAAAALGGVGTWLLVSGLRTPESGATVAESPAISVLQLRPEPGGGVVLVGGRF